MVWENDVVIVHLSLSPHPHTHTCLASRDNCNRMLPFYHKGIFGLTLKSRWGCCGSPQRASPGCSPTPERQRESTMHGGEGGEGRGGEGREGGEMGGEKGGEGREKRCIKSKDCFSH